MDKKNVLISQKDLIYNMLLSGNSFHEMELTKAITDVSPRGARALISVLRREGIQIASKNITNPWTGRLNKSYYLENDTAKYIKWCLNNGYFEFKKGAPK